MKHLLTKEIAEKSTSYDQDENVVTCVHATVHKSIGDGERFQMTWGIKLGGLTDAQIAEACAEYFIIKIRRTFAKVDKPAASDWDNVTFDAKDYVSVRVSKTEKLARTLADFSDDELAALGLKRS